MKRRTLRAALQLMCLVGVGIGALGVLSGIKGTDAATPTEPSPTSVRDTDEPRSDRPDRESDRTRGAETAQRDEGSERNPPGERTPDAHATLANLGPLSGASEVDRRSDMRFTDEQLRCPSAVPEADLVKRMIFEVWAAARDARDPLTGPEERELGDEIHAEFVSAPDSPFRGKIDNDPALLRYVEDVTEPFLDYLEREDLPITLHVVDDPTPNAFAIPGGHVYVQSGLVRGGRDGAINEAELAAVMAHELAHVDRRHTAAVFEVIRDMGLADTVAEIPMSQLLLLAQQPYSSELEDEADRYSVERMLQVGYSPLQMALMWDRWAARDGSNTAPARSPEEVLIGVLEEVVQSHSNSEVRACNVRNEIRDGLSETDRERFYVGTTNLRREVAAGEQLY